MAAPQKLEGPSGLLLDLAQRSVTVNGSPVSLSRREFDMLQLLLERRGSVVTFDELSEHVWGHAATTSDQRFIYTTAWRVRRALEAAGAHDVVVGVRGIGYLAPDDDPEDRGDVSAVAVFDPDDPDLRLWMANDAAAELTGYDVRTLTHLPYRGIKLWDPAERALIDVAVRSAMRDGFAESHGRCMNRGDGAQLRVDVRFTRLDHGHREPRMLVEVVRSEVINPAADRAEPETTAPELTGTR